MRRVSVLLAAPPALAMAAVAAGLWLGADKPRQAVQVVGARPSMARTGLAWQLVSFEQRGSAREMVSIPALDVLARSKGRIARWHGATNEDGAAEMLLELPAAFPVHIEVRSSAGLLASGDVAPPPPRDRDGPRPSPWTRFAHRAGDVLLDVAVLGQRAASGFAAVLWVHASDATTRASLPGVVVETDSDPSLRGSTPSARTDRRGWARLETTPVGFAPSLALRARGPDGRRGEWTGPLWVSPGAAQIVMPDRVDPSDQPTIEVVAPAVRETTSYLEIDDAQGRAWGAPVRLAVSHPAAGVHPEQTAAMDLPHGFVVAPKLAPGLYWVVTSDNPSGGADLGPGTRTRPFFVAASDDEALSFGLDRSACSSDSGADDTARAIEPCLALATPVPTPRWIAIDGTVVQRARAARRRAAGLTLALGAIAVAGVVEVLALVGAARGARRRWLVFVAVCVGLLGLGLMGVFVGRFG